MLPPRCGLHLKLQGNKKEPSSRDARRLRDPPHASFFCTPSGVVEYTRSDSGIESRV